LLGFFVCLLEKKYLIFLDYFGSEGVLAVNINLVGWTKCFLKVMELLLKDIFVYGYTGKRGGI